MSAPAPYRSYTSGISSAIDSAIVGNVPLESLNPPDLLHKAKLHLSKMAPEFTVVALENAFCSRIRDDWLGLTKMTRASGFLMLLPSAAIDVVKAPYYLLRATLSASRYIFQNEKITEEILESFYQRFESTLMILLQLNIETPTKLHTELNEGRAGPFLALTLFFTAFASRRAPSGYISLANDQKLSRKVCPKIGLSIFDHVHKLKNDLILAGLSQQTAPEAAEQIHTWLPHVMQILKHPEITTPELPEPLQNTLRNIQTEINTFPVPKQEEERYGAAVIAVQQRDAQGPCQPGASTPYS